MRIKERTNFMARQKYVINLIVAKNSVRRTLLDLMKAAEDDQRQDTNIQESGVSTSHLVVGKDR